MEHPADLDVALGRLARALRRRMLAVELTRLVGWALPALACAALLLRALFDLPSSRAAWILAPLLAAGPLALRRARARVPARAELAAWLDRRGGGSGALVTAFETRDPVWAGRLAGALPKVWAAERPRGRLPWRRLGLRVLPGLAFALLALLVPLPARAPWTGPDALSLRLADELREKLAALAETVTLDERVADELETRLARLEEGLGQGGESFLEAADALDERLGALAQRAAEEAAAARAALESAQGGERGPGGQHDATAQALASALANLRAGGLERLVPGELDPLLGSLTLGEGAPPGFVSDADLDPETLAQLSAALAASLARGLEGLERAGLLDPAKLRAAQELESLSELLAKLHTCDDSCRQGGT